MPYIGNEVGNRFVASKAASVYSGDGSTTAFTLEHAVGSDEDILVSVDGVIQEPSVAYAVSSGTTLTFTAAPSTNSGNNIFVYYLFRTVATVDHPSTSSLQATDATFSAGVTATTGTFSSTLNVTGETTITTADNNPQLILKSTDADANGGPLLDLMRDSSSPADNDAMGSIRFRGDDDAGNETQYVDVTAYAPDVSDGSEDGQLQFRSVVGGTLRNRFDINPTEVVFNEDSVDVDFRVESNGNANALIVDGGHSTVGINTAAVSNRTLKIEGEGNTGAILSLNESTRGGLVEFSAGSGTELYIGSELGILGSGNNNEFLIHTGVSALKIDRTGAVTKPLQPAFLVRPTSTQSNISINAYTTIVFDTEVFDNNSDFASNTFTAPVTGKYQFNCSLYFTGIDTDTTFYQLYVTTSNREHLSIVSGDGFNADPSYHTINHSVLTDMDANDTCYIRLQISAGGSSSADLTTQTRFSGYLVA
jgi:hypothetical protein